MSSRLKADLALAACTLLWGATFVVVQRALESASVFVFMALRFGLGALVLALMYRRAVAALSRDEIRAGVEIGLFLFCGYAFQNAGLLYTSASNVAFITGFGVVLVPLLLAVFWRRRVSGWAGGGAVLALAGLYFLTVPAGAGFAGVNRGDLLAFVCSVMFALHIIFIGRYTGKHSVAALTFVQVAASGALSAAAIPAFAAAGMEAARLAWTGALIFGVLITAIGATAIAFSAQVWAQRYTTASHTAILLTLEPVFAALTSYVVLHERLGPRALIGAGLILAGILLAELKGPMQSAADSPGPVTEVAESTTVSETPPSGERESRDD